MSDPGRVIDYPRFHQDRVNLLIHVLVVPLFVIGALGALASLVAGRWLGAVLFALLPPVSLALQGIGHKREPNPPLPFLGAGDFLGRVLVEQFYRFPRYVVTGGWRQAWRAAAPEANRRA